MGWAAIPNWAENNLQESVLSIRDFQNVGLGEIQTDASDESEAESEFRKKSHFLHCWRHVSGILFSGPFQITKNAQELICQSGNFNYTFEDFQWTWLKNFADRTSRSLAKIDEILHENVQYPRTQYQQKGFVHILQVSHHFMKIAGHENFSHLSGSCDTFSLLKWVT